MSYIYLGNLSVAQMEKRLGITLSDEHRERLESTRQRQINSVNIEHGFWHCFDAPFVMMCGDKETAASFYEMLRDYPIECPFRVLWDRDGE